jgi:hypothetical protein
MCYIGRVIQAAINNGLKVTNVRSVKYNGSADLPPTVPSGDLVAFEIKGADAIEGFNKLIQDDNTFQQNICYVSQSKEAAQK